MSYPQTTFSNGEGKHIKSITLGRFGNFLGGHYAEANLSAALFHHKTDVSSAVKLEVWSPPTGEKPTFEEAKRAKYKPAKKGDKFGPSWSNHWWRITLNVPKEYAKYERVQFEFDPGCEGLIYTNEGVPIHALVGGFDNLRRVEHILDKTARKGPYHIYIETSCNGMFGVPQGGNEIEPPDPNRYFPLASADIVVPNMEAWRLMWDFNLLVQIAQQDGANSPLSERAMRAANSIISTYRVTDTETTIPLCRKIAEDILGAGWEKDGHKVWEKGPKDEAKLWAMGHCHIDSAWLWPFTVTKQKVARSWSTQVDLMDRYPEHHFSATSAQQYKWLENLYPTLFDKVKAKIEGGQFKHIGATWLECDTNLPSGESLCRQFLYGQRFFQSRFGKQCPTFVLPDTFGYSSQLPQIARLGGSKNFFTQKLSWNNINKFPHSSFNWVGLDGSQLLTHMTPVDTYNAQCDYGEVVKGNRGHKNLEVTQDALFLFGNGDGGGGPTPPMLEKLRRLRAVGNANREVPLIKIGEHMDEFFEHLRESTDGGSKLPNWRGELYFELHRGTYTSHASIKKGNRKNEIRLRDVEYVATLASLLGRDKHYVYPQVRLDECWENLLLCQFHDVLPGSCIAMVYDDAERYYAEIEKACAEMMEDAFKILLADSVPLSAISSFSSSAKIFAINTLRTPRREIVAVPLDSSKRSLKASVAQISADGREGYLFVDATGPGIGEIKGVFADVQGVSAKHVGKGEYSLSSSSIEFKIRNGRIASIYDVELRRELIPKDKTGGFVIFQDMPNYWDAWDTEIHHLESPTHLEFSSVSVAENGPLRASLAAKVRVGQSVINCKISLDAIGSSVDKSSRSMIRFETDVDWRERHRFLKFELPVNIHASDATFETQFGTVSRPTHRNTSWDQAKFEVCAHKFVDLSEFGYGVGLINESKYGHAVDGETIRLSLLRSPTAPDPNQDQGAQHFAFAVYPHVGTFAESDLPQVAYAFNSPMHLRAIPDTLATTKLLASSTLNSAVTVEGARNVIAETIKRGEDDDHKGGNKHVIVRLYEAYGGHARATLRIAGLHVTRAILTNVLEEELGSPLKVGSSFDGEDATVDLEFRGFEIKTVKLTIGDMASKERECEWVRVEPR